MQRLSSLGALALALAATFLLPAAAAAKAPSKPPKTYRVGMAARSVNLDANGTFAGGTVYLGGYGLGNGRLLDHFGNVENPG
ncbi:MAG: hypothetical protein QOE11_3315, partial [Solirubrobacteraceae bacterium]|nr:hypothetical protein [Solirubrobacteraceae bacterium]